jgi:hypothetical protein
MNTREAFEQSGAGGEFEPPIDWDDPSVAHARRTWQAATAAERERCAKVCDALCDDYGSRYKNTPPNERRPARVSTYTKGVSVGAGLCADAIRSGE